MYARNVWNRNFRYNDPRGGGSSRSGSRPWHLYLALLINIFERKQEARNPFYRVVELNDTIDDPATWAKNFPLQYDLYMLTVDMQRTKYGGSEAMPHSPTQADPRSVVARSKLQEDPRLKTIWAGYSFSADYRERRPCASIAMRPWLLPF